MPFRTKSGSKRKKPKSTKLNGQGAQEGCSPEQDYASGCTTKKTCHHRNPSPERESIIFASLHEESVAPEIIPEENIVVVYQTAADPEAYIPEQDQEIETETSDMPIQEGSTTEYYTVAELAEPQYNLGPEPRLSTSKNTIGDLESNFAMTVTNWLDRALDSDVDDDDDDKVEDSVFRPLQTSLNTCSVMDYPADNSGLNPEQIAAARALEEHDDRCLQVMAAPINSPTCFDFEWTNDRQSFIGKREIFAGSAGPTFNVTNDLTPVEIFLKMFDTDFFDLIVTETNRYAEQTLTAFRLNETTPKFARCLKWTPTDRNEIMTFLAVIILQGLYPKVNEEAYFNFDGFGTTPYFRGIMSFNRYYLLKSFMHFTDNNQNTDMTKLNKIRPVIDYMNRQFASLYSPGQEMALDESLLKWYGRLSFAQKIRSKAAQVGVKTYELCESSTGYLWAFRVYTGKDGDNRTGQGLDHQPCSSRDAHDGQNSERTEERYESSELRPQNATSKIVFDLVEPLLDRGHTLIMDNFYNSPLLARCLKKRKTDVFGTLRLTREFVPEALKTLTKTDMRQGEVAVSYCSDLAVMVWRDANLVSMISTYHPLQVGTIDKNNRMVYKPAIILDYNKTMGGVDRKDQFLASQPCERQRNKVWYKKLFRRLFNVAVFNCHILFTSNTQNKRISHRSFRIMLAETLLKMYRNIDLTTTPRLSMQKQTNRLTVRHTARPFIEGNHFPMKTGSNATRCWICTRKKKPTRTAYKCEECNINLCIVGCFKEYHKPQKQL